ncbi:MAG: hypothetical protein LC114_17185 [Bryobacterales bacterium]|nr:hypothetical protein [Bryobacterales bacterium]
MERIKNAALVFCLFVFLLVIFSSYFRANELGSLCGALTGTPLLVHVFNRLMSLGRGPELKAHSREAPLLGESSPSTREQVVVLRLEGSTGNRDQAAGR